MAAEPAPNSARVTRSARVLSIQSSVVYGYVGNRSAVLPLQLLGIEVDPLNSVQLSNHTGYARFSGNKFEGAELDRLVEGLDANGFLAEYSHVLTGYIGTESFLQRTVELVKARPRARPSSAVLAAHTPPILRRP
jgi:pyridoxine kinase